jgi:hypothetical protein
MTQENITQSGGPRRRRRGGRRSGSGSGSGSPQHRSSRPYESKNEPAPATGIVGFFKKLFGIKTKPAARTQAPARTDRFERTDRPDRPDRTDRPARQDRSDRPVRAERPDRHSTADSGAPVREPKTSERHSEPASSTPEEIEVTTPKLYVGNLSYDSSESDVFDLFSKAGQVKNVEIVRDRNSNSKGFGFVEMNSIEGAKDAALKYHRFQFMERQLIVSGARR